MAGTSLIALIDDIASILDDVSVLTKVAAKKTAGVLGDDLALNAEQVAGVAAEREIPVVLAVAKGSLVNKVILVPAALGLSAVAPFLVRPLLMVGGAFLCFEGFEKIAHKIFHRRGEHHDPAKHLAEIANPAVDLLALEKDKIKGAIRTDFVLSAEIVAISLGAVADAPFVTRAGVLVGISLLMTIGVYGLVAGIVKLDDLGFHLVGQPAAGVAKGGTPFRRWLGLGILATAPRLMRFLSVAGTAAMFLVGGGILTHGIPPVEHGIDAAAQAAQAVPAVGGVLAAIVSPVLNGLAGVVAGGIALAVVSAVKAVIHRMRKSRP